MTENIEKQALRLFNAVRPGDVCAVQNARDEFTDEDWEVLKRSKKVVKAFQAAWQRALLPNNHIKTRTVTLDEGDHCIPGLRFKVKIPKD